MADLVTGSQTDLGFVLPQRRFSLIQLCLSLLHPETKVRIIEPDDHLSPPNRAANVDADGGDFARRL